jgi:hypothetical protein
MTTTENGASNANWSNGAALTWQIQVSTPGTYHVWVRKNRNGGGSNSAWIGLDGVQIGNEFDNGPGNGWLWMDHSSTISLSAGSHAFEIRRREDGYHIDQILLTDDPNYVPSGTLTESNLIWAD